MHTISQDPILDQQLFESVIANNFSETSSLIEQGANVNTANKEWQGATPLYMATQTNSLSIIKLLLEHNANTETTLIDLPSTPLYVAAFYNYPEAVILFLKHGANINAQVNRRDVIQMASNKEHTKIVEILTKGVEAFCGALSEADSHFSDFC